MDTTLDLTADVIDVRDIIERVKELEEPTIEPVKEELAELTAILDDLKGYGGDEQWRGDWYPITLIRYSYFTEYVREMLADCGDIPANLPHYIEIDWGATVRNIRTDYSSTDIDGVTYWYR